MKILFIIIAGMILLSGCSTELVTDRKLPRVIGEDYCLVNIVREPRFVGSMVALMIQLDGDDLLHIGNGDCVKFKIPSGANEIALSASAAWTGLPVRKRIKFNGEKMQSYYFYVREDAGKSGPEFRQLSKKDWDEMSKSCNWISIEK